MPSEEDIDERKSRSLIFDTIYSGFVTFVILPFINRFLRPIVHGTSEVLHVELPSISRSLTFGGQKKAAENNNENEPVTLLIDRPVHFCWLLLLDEKLGLGEAYMVGDWRASPGITQFLCLLIRAKREKKEDARRSGDPSGKRPASSTVSKALSLAAASSLSTLRWLAACYNYIHHRIRDNTIMRSRQNISEHYDLGNQMFELFLDRSMTYSCALFEDPDAPLSSPADFDRLEKAQYRKIDALLDSLHLTVDDHVLEIGCGWGSAAIRAVKRFGCRWTGLTISTEQLELAKERVAAAGLEDRIEFKLTDYRLEPGTYSAVLSIEMIEAVGEQFLPQYFQIIHDRLAPGGRCAIQAILCPDAYYDRYRSSSDFIKKHIFPGGHLPSYRAISDSLPRCGASGAALLEYDVEREMPRHYAHTLDHWHSAWMARESSILSLGYSPVFHRKWQFYFALCSALFSHDHINVAQITLRKGGKAGVQKDNVAEESCQGTPILVQHLAYT